MTDAYFAGLFDGEGTLRISFNGRQYQLLASLGMTHQVPVQGLCDRFGGWIELRSNGGTRWRPVYIWRASSSGAMRLIDAIEPFLVVKKPHAEAAREFQSLMTRKTAMADVHKAQLYERMKELNKRGI